MKIFVPDYYTEFSCIADKCKHSCCIGWEIDIDDYTLELYKGIDGELGKKLSQNIVTDEDNVHSFKLCEGERCPFLNEKGLCELILEKGEDILCDICNDHPRFRNFYSDRTEMGLGLCCEAVSELVCGRKKKTEMLLLSDDQYEEEPLTENETELFKSKEKVIAALQDRSMPYKQRVRSVCGLREYDTKELYDILYPLERLDKGWDVVLSSLLRCDESVCCEYDTVCEQLSVYFVFRHLNDECENMDNSLFFSLFSVQAIMKLATAYYGNALDTAKISDIARMYSAEIEYSDCNIDEIIKKI